MAILATEKVLTLDWWKLASKLEVGDYVFDKEGRPVKITLVQQYRPESCYEVMFNDYLTASGDEHLALPTENSKYRKRTYEYRGVQQFKRPLKLIPVSKLLPLSLKNKNNRLEYSVPTAKAIALPHKDYPVPPFIFGFWFFSRRSTKKLAPARGYSEYVTKKFKDHGYKVTEHGILTTGEREISVSPTIESQLIPNVPNQLTQNYLLGSPEQRIELLSGILCAKNRQYSEKTDTFRFTSHHFGTVKLIQGLVESIGCKSKLTHDEYLNNYTISFKSRTQLVPNQVSPPVKVHQARRYVNTISSIPAQLCVHIETNGADNTILVGEGFISVC
jgi:hypothetical protein